MDLSAAALVSAGADLLPEQNGVGAAGVPSLAQVGCVLIEDAGATAGAIMDVSAVMTVAANARRIPVLPPKRPGG